MIRIKGIDNQLLELEIVSYQFPEISDEKYDANWLNIYFNLDLKFGKWRTTDACLLTWEVEEIIGWLKSLANYEKVENELSFIEPNLTIKRIAEEDNVTRLRFVFDHELRPERIIENLQYHIDCDLTKDGIIRLAQDFETELSKFPEKIVKEK